MPVFKGWVPTITGHLSFSTIGLGRNPKKLFKKFLAVDGVRYLVVAQERRTSDALFGQVGDAINRFRRRKGRSIFVLFGKCFKKDGYNEISGPCLEFSVKKYQTIKHRLENLAVDMEVDEFGRMFDQISQELLEEVDDWPGAVTAVSLLRDGNFTVEISKEDTEDSKMQSLLASQVYFFVRDVTHTHQHHAETSDTILDVTNVDDDPDAWKRETAYSLYRWVIQQKRAKIISSYQGAIGVLTYARAFEKRFKDKTGKLPKYLNEPTESSIKAAIEQVRETDANRRVFWRLFFNRTLPILGFVIAILALVYENPAGAQLTFSQKAMAGITEFVNREMFSIIGVLFAISVVFNIGFVFRAQLVQAQIALDFFRFAVCAPRLFVLILTLTLILTTAYFATTAFFELGIVLQPYELGP